MNIKYLDHDRMELLIDRAFDEEIYDLDDESLFHNIFEKWLYSEIRIHVNDLRIKHLEEIVQSNTKIYDLRLDILKNIRVR